MRPLSEKEIQASIKGLHGEGSPGPNGTPVFFYRDFWDLVGQDVMAMHEEFSHENRGIERINKSHLLLLPNRQGANKVKYFCPISLSHSIYLIIAEVLENRLHEVINQPVRPIQSAFILGRQLVNSAIVESEIVAA